jgi:hypothetical protein
MSCFVAPLRVKCGFRLDDGLGRDRKSRANRRAAVFGELASHRVTPGGREDLLDGPTLRLGQRRGDGLTSPSHELSGRDPSTRSGSLRDAKPTTLGLFDELGQHKARRLPGRVGPDELFLEQANAAARKWSRFAATEFDVFESPRTRARPGDSVDTPFGNEKEKDTSTSTRRGKHQRVVLGILTAPSSRLGRKARKQTMMGSTPAVIGESESVSRKMYSAGRTASPLLGILSGPNKRLGRGSNRG